MTKSAGLGALLFLAAPLFAQNTGLFPFPENGKWGYINASGEKIIPADYESAAPFSEGLGRIARAANGEVYYGFINEGGVEVIPPKFSSVSFFKGGLAVVSVQGKMAYLRKDGSLSEELFDEIHPLSEGLSRFKRGGLYGYADRNASVAILPSYIEAGDFSAGLALVQLNGNYGYINKDGSFTIPPLFPEAKDFSEGCAAVKGAEGWNLINKFGDTLTTRPYEMMNPLSNGYARVLYNGSYGFIDASGELVIPSVPGEPDDFSEGLARVFFQGRVGYINKKGEYADGSGIFTNAPAYPFTMGTRFDGRLARVASEQGSGFMNSEGRFNLSGKISALGSFFNGRSRVKVGRYYGYFDEDARTRIKPIYLQAGEFQSALAPVLAAVPGGYRAAYINTNGEEVYAWDVFAKPVPADKEKLFVISEPGPPFLKESDPESQIITRMGYGAEVQKSFQRTATPLSGLGMQGLLYAARYSGREGFLFSELISVFPAPRKGMGIFSYFQDKFGAVSLSAPIESEKLTAAFFNGAILNRSIENGLVTDSYYIPYMKLTDAFFILSAALGETASFYPQNGEKEGFSRADDAKGRPISFTLRIGDHLLSVSEAGEGLQAEHCYPKF